MEYLTPYEKEREIQVAKNQERLNVRARLVERGYPLFPPGVPPAPARVCATRVSARVRRA